MIKPIADTDVDNIKQEYLTYNMRLNDDQEHQK